MIEVIILPQERIYRTEGALVSKVNKVKLESSWLMLAMFIQAPPKEEGSLT